MAKSLVIVESVAKSKTINRFLGKDYVVKASVGHIKNLPKNRLGVDLENGFEPEYITIRGRGQVLRELKRLATVSDCILLATDPDREGEAIASHLASEIEPANNNIQRVLFYEITEKAIQEAIHLPKPIDYKKVDAQKARRVMDRLVGYQVSPILWKTIYTGLSAGRVQSVALRLVCEREEEISGFVSKEYWSLEADFKTKEGTTFRSKLVKINGENVDIPDEDGVKRHIHVLKGFEYIVSDSKTNTVMRHPLPPYNTSTLQQDCSRRFGMTTKRIMAIAQELYEGVDLPEGRVGLITYMRTDSTRLAQTAVQDVRQYIADNYGLEYVPPKPRLYRHKKRTQDAHEAIRPTSVLCPPNKVAAYLKPEQKKVYELIWNRFVACQMASAQLLQSTLEITAGQYLFRTTATVVQFKGFMQVYAVDKEADENFSFPESLKRGDRVFLEKLYPQQHFTKPPPRYSESSLVKEMDNQGIGRPSTYALVISTLLERKYVERDARSLKAADLGMAVNRILVQQFPDIFNIGFTAQMEEELDQIESGEKNRQQVLENFYHPFSLAVKRTMEKKEEIKESLQEDQNEQCPKCGRELVVKWGRNGRFVACTGYPKCKYTKPLEIDIIETDEKCIHCGSKLTVRNGRYGRFLACSNYPECKYTKPYSMGIHCPEDKCDGQIVERKSRRGKTFFGCSNYPACHFATWYRPISVQCQKCGNLYMEEKSTKAKGHHLQCPKCKNIIHKEETLGSMENQ